MEKAVSWYKADGLVASLLSFHSVQSSIAPREFRAAGEELSANEATDGCVRTYYAWCRGAQSVSEQSQLCEPTFGFTTREFSMVGGYTETKSGLPGYGRLPGQH